MVMPKKSVDALFDTVLTVGDVYNVMFPASFAGTRYSFKARLLAVSLEDQTRCFQQLGKKEENLGPIHFIPFSLALITKDAPLPETEEAS